MSFYKFFSYAVIVSCSLSEVNKTKLLIIMGVSFTVMYFFLWSTLGVTPLDIRNHINEKINCR